MQMDWIIKNGFVYQTHRQCFEKMDIAIADGRFYSIEQSIVCPQDVKTVDYSGKYIVPGLIDIHMHIESSMTYPQQFSKTVLPYGVTTVVADPHEIANVFGLEGVEAFMQQQTTLDIFYGIPSSVPTTNEQIETCGGIIDEPEVEKLLEHDSILCLGEVMNFVDLVAPHETKIQRIIRQCKNHPKHLLIEGHCPKMSYQDIERFVFAGVDSDHTQQSAQSIIDKINLGMFLEIQEKSITPETIAVIVQNHLYEQIALVTDDTMPDKLLKGQLDQILREAVAAGMPIHWAIYCATYTPARRMRLDDRGIIAPGKIADFVVLEALESFKVEAVYKNGYKYEKEEIDASVSPFPSSFYESVHCDLALEADFEIKIEQPCKQVLVNVIKLSEFGTFTEQVQRSLSVENGKVCWQEAGLSIVAVFERYGKNGNKALGLVEGAFLKPAAVATTWSHDSHNLIVVGNSIADMVNAQQQVVQLQGGYVISVAEQIRAKATLNVGGILFDGPIEQLAIEMYNIRSIMKELGYNNSNAIMSVSTLALTVSPELKITDQGLFNVKTHKFVPLIAQYY
jgi:adenine deaminase